MIGKEEKKSRKVIKIKSKAKKTPKNKKTNNLVRKEDNVKTNIIGSKYRWPMMKQKMWKEEEWKRRIEGKKAKNINGKQKQEKS